MRITEHQIRQIIREELMLLTEQSVLSSYQQPVPVNNGTQIMIETQPPAQPPGSVAPPATIRRRTSKKLGVRVITTVFNQEVSTIFDISGLTIQSWNPSAPDGQPFMTVSFKVAGETKTSVTLKNKIALKRIADAILSGTKAEGELIPIDPAKPDGIKTALIVNY
jgi:hypothetical protein